MGANPKSQTNQEKHLLKKIQGSPTSDEAHRQDYDETVRRLRDNVVEAAPAKPANYIQPTKPAQPPPGNPVELGPDRYHKKNKGMVFVTMDEFSGDDPILAAGYAPNGQPATITAAYAKAKELVSRRTDANARVLVSVHGGDWYEALTFDDPNVDVVGIGRPRLWYVPITNPADSTPVVTITADCTKILFAGFEIITTLSEGYLGPDLVGLRIKDTATPAPIDYIPDVEVRDCYFRGLAQCVWTSRRTRFLNCDFYRANSGDDTFPNVRVQAPILSSKIHWTEFSDCRFYAEGARVNYFDAGWALSIDCVDDLGVWVAPGATGVELCNCEISGWTSNYGWTYRAVGDYNGTEGYQINITSGSVHHRMWCNSDSAINANTFFDGGWVGCRYLAEVNDISAVAVAAQTNVWIRNFTHGGNSDSTPPNIAGTSVHTSFSGTVPAIVNVYKAGSSSGASQGFYAPGGVELAVGGNSAFNVPITTMSNPFTNR